MKFSPSGDVVASGSFDKHIFLWNTYGDCENFMMLKGGQPAPATPLRPKFAPVSMALMMVELV